MTNRIITLEKPALREQKAGSTFGCNFHDIKAKGTSDYEGSRRDKQLFSGHKTKSQVLLLQIFARWPLEVDRTNVAASRLRQHKTNRFPDRTAIH